MWACLYHMLLRQCDSQGSGSKEQCSQTPVSRPVFAKQWNEADSCLQELGRRSDLDVSQSIGKAGCASEADQYFGAAPRQQYLHITRSCICQTKSVQFEGLMTTLLPLQFQGVGKLVQETLVLIYCSLPSYQQTESACSCTDSH